MAQYYLNMSDTLESEVFAEGTEMQDQYIVAGDSLPSLVNPAFSAVVVRYRFCLGLCVWEFS